jgi:hypothetical protein
MSSEIQNHIDSILALIPLPKNPDAKDKFKKISLERKLLEWYVEYEDYLEDNHIGTNSGNTSVNQTALGHNNRQNIQV